jgi:L-ribulose-5-phosphate 3-epimerase
MGLIRLGVAVDDLGLGTKEGLQEAARLGYGAVELGGVGGDIEPANLSQSGVRHLRKFVEGLGLEVSVLGGPAGRGGLGDPATVDERIDKTRQILELARRLRVPVVTVHLGRVPDDPRDRRRGLIVEALDCIGEHADKVGVLLAAASDEDAPAALRRLLDELNCPALRVCYDPGGLLMHGHDPTAGVGDLAGLIAASHLRDATRGSATAAGREVRMGSGQVNFIEYLAALEQGAYQGPQIVRRTEATDPVAEIAAARQYLEGLLR